MAYIEPSTSIILCSGVRLDRTYENTILFENPTAQINYFNSKRHRFASGAQIPMLERHSYQRVNRNTIRIQYSCDDLYGVNYMAFRNTNFGDKWFYAFVNSINYVNNVTSEIEYEIDVMQSWMFAYGLGTCFVERCHTPTDYIGDNLVPENLEHGEYITDGFTRLHNTGIPSYVADYKYVVMCTYDYPEGGGLWEKVYGGLYSGVYQGVNFKAFDSAELAKNFIINCSGKGEGAVVGLFLMPSRFITEQGATAPKSYECAVGKAYSDVYGSVGTDWTRPHNCKLYTYPYNFLYMTNMQGNSAEYRYEYFTGDRCSFKLTGDYSPNPAIICAPIRYKGTKANDNYDGVNYDEKLTISGFPQLAWSSDAYAAWLAQNGSSLAVNGLSSAVAMAFGLSGHGMATTGNHLLRAQRSQTFDQFGTVQGARDAFSGAVGVASTLATIADHHRMPPQSHGGGGSVTAITAKALDFAYCNKHIRPEFAKIIDDYFSMYGYAVHQLQTPNLQARPCFTYIKTSMCELNNSHLNNDDAEKIKSIYNNGITFWKQAYADRIGDYYGRLDSGKLIVEANEATQRGAH